jgi:hypothetical protein
MHEMKMEHLEDVRDILIEKFVNNKVNLGLCKIKEEIIKEIIS